RGAFLFGRRSLAGEEHEVEVAEWRHLAAARAAERDNRDSTGRFIEDPTCDEIVCQPNELVVEEGRGLGRGAAIAGLVQEPPGDLRPAMFEGSAENRRGLGSELLATSKARQGV